MSTSSQHLRSHVFDSKSVDNNFTALDANTEAIEFTIFNRTAKGLSIRIGASGDTIEIADGDNITLKGNPANYQVKNNSDTATISIKLLIGTI